MAAGSCRRRGYALNQSSDFDAVREVKEAQAYVACDYARELQASKRGGASAAHAHARIAERYTGGV